MKRMKTFLIYALILIGFFALSMVLENGFLMAMYKNIPGNFHGEYSDSNEPFLVENISVKASNVTGYINFDFINNTGKYIDKCYLKVDLYNSQNLLAATKYIEVVGMQPNTKKTYNIKFRANNIKGYNISIVKDVPDKTNILDIFGWEIDLSNVLGLGIDLTNISIFGNKLTDLLSKTGLTGSGVKGAATSLFDLIKSLWFKFSITAAAIPPWAYLFAWMYIVGVL